MYWLIRCVRYVFLVTQLKLKSTIKNWLMKQTIPCLRGVNYAKTLVFKASRSKMWPSFSPKRNPEANLCLTWTRTLTNGILPYGFASNMLSAGSNVIELLKTKFVIGNLALRTLFLRPVAVFTISDWIFDLGLTNLFNFTFLSISNRYNV